jgi:hypothetical protein
MRNQIIASVVLSLAALTANAQNTDRRTSMEPAHSPFTYEALGATPSLRLGKRAAPAAQTVAAPLATERRNTAVQSEQSVDTAIAADRSRSDRAIKR